jgi:hypothetical protein
MTEITAPLPVAAVTDCPIFAGPQRAERLGNTLRVDLGSQDMALAVSRDNRMPRASVVVTTAARHMIRISKGGEKVEGLAVWGSVADPTLHPDFREITENLRDLRNKWFAKAKLCLLLENPQLVDGQTRHALTLFDRVYLRLEWGTAKTFSAMTGRKSAEHAAILAALTGLENLHVVARFLKGDGIDSGSDAEVRAWLKKVADLKPREVIVLRSEQGLGKKLRPVPKARLDAIVAEAAEKLGIPASLHEAESVLD